MKKDVESFQTSLVDEKAKKKMIEEENENLKIQINSLNFELDAKVFEIGSLKKHFQQENGKLLSDVRTESSLR
jgi:hypothetical protein